MDIPICYFAHNKIGKEETRLERLSALARPHLPNLLRQTVLPLFPSLLPPQFLLPRCHASLCLFSDDGECGSITRVQRGSECRWWNLFWSGKPSALFFRSSSLSLRVLQFHRDWSTTTSPPSSKTKEGRLVRVFMKSSNLCLDIRSFREILPLLEEPKVEKSPEISTILLIN